MEFQLFKPGEIINLPIKIGMQQPISKGVKVDFPARIHMTPIDCNRFDFGKPGGGGYGFAIDIKNSLKLQLSTQEKIKAPDSQVPVVQHYLHIMRKLFKYDGKFEVEVEFDEIMKQHFGLGSTAVLSSALVWAINRLFGSPLTKNQCRDIVTANFAEGCQGSLARGLDTGVGTYVALHGGFVTVGDKAEVIFSKNMPETFYVILVDCGATRPKSDLPESVEMLRRSRELDSYYRYFKCYAIIMDIIPAIKKGDWKRFGQINWEFQFAGTHLSMLQGYDDRGIKLISTLTSLRDAGALVVGMSSVGPAIYAISDDPNPIISKVERLGFKYRIVRPCNEGIVDELI